MRLYKIRAEREDRSREQQQERDHALEDDRRRLQQQHRAAERADEAHEQWKQEQVAMLADLFFVAARAAENADPHGRIVRRVRRNRRNADEDERREREETSPTRNAVNRTGRESDRSQGRDVGKIQRRQRGRLTGCGKTRGLRIGPECFVETRSDEEATP